MKNENGSEPRGKKIEFFLPVFVAVIFFCFIFLFFPFREIIQFDPDEGLNLMRSMLVSLQHPLYSAVSSDQPPLFTYILSWLFKFAGFEVNPARILVLLFSTIMIYSCAQMLKMAWGNLSSILFLLFVLGIPNLIKLSVSVMIGIPALSLACLSALMLFNWQRSRLKIFLYFSAFFLAISVLIKLFTIFLAPVLILTILGSEYLYRNEKQLRLNQLFQSILWSSVFGAALFIFGLLLINPSNVFQLISPHVTAESNIQYQGYGATINYRLESVIPLLFVSFLGLIHAVKQKNKFSYLVAIWIGFAYILLSLHHPVYSHHQLLITIPAAMLASCGGSKSIQFFFLEKKRTEQFFFTGLLSILTIIFMIFTFFTNYLSVFPNLRYFPQLSGFILQGTPGKLQIINEMKSYQNQTNWIFTDLPMYAFRVKKPVPPILATFSEKRYLTGSLTDADLLNTLQKYRPEQIMMGRFTINALEQTITKNYKLISSPGSFRLYIRNDLIRKK